MQLLDKALSFIAPLECVGCGQEGALLCGMCLAGVPNVPSRCFRCMAATHEYAVCPACRRVTALRRVWVASVYEGLIKELVRKYKYERAMSASTALAALLTNTLPLLEETIIVAVPTATSRRRQRGYDHALLLAKAVADQKGMVYATPVVRLSQVRQVGATRKERFEQLQNNFLIIKPQQVAAKKILLVDDVITTGATLETLAKLFKQAGAKEVNAVVCAQKL